MSTIKIIKIKENEMKKLMILTTLCALSFAGSIHSDAVVSGKNVAGTWNQSCTVETAKFENDILTASCNTGAFNTFRPSAIQVRGATIHNCNGQLTRNSCDANERVLAATEEGTMRATGQVRLS